ncbi:uncharacterized protein F5891DRAFT_1144270 [Suillus fuscotomentosus]|uniref:Heterokaryon incompatibility domain-containing protein n=1 Tax=Suillus fuscotomentosus TaxID=1912939 RepID=A0AAD4E8W3_9AGAM|nr:uncharacterized protein F5891DRAFT_1144270 [Suillus fuscotomentosus]KAG1901747.1 hypothetical protein F5891DRAFT_1144270 [Suillus fuscotomentosus]
MGLRDVEDAFNRYIFDEVPVRLLYLPQMKLLERDSLKRLYQPHIDHITEADLNHPIDRSAAIGGKIREQLKYGILSHRWLSLEPSFQDIMSGKTLDGPGWDKLREFCRVANKVYGVELVWSDTCCIDKTSSSELDESLRCMFRWYRNAHICITYLAETTSVDQFHNDEWFTRGWTLQELLAPRKIRFFRKDWIPLTNYTIDKDRPAADQPILDIITEVTSISSQDLQAFVPGPFQVDTRMVWAADRKTTRSEDVAYSLMGIFDVSIPIAYGEGAQRAFFRLVEAIMQVSNEPGVLNWAGKPAQIHRLSTAFPSAPACYLGHPHYDRSLATDEKREFALTNRGLRIQLLVIPIDLVTRLIPPATSIQDRATFRCNAFKINGLTIDGPSFPVLERTGTNRYAYSLGIINYAMIQGESKNPVLPKSCIAYLLIRLKGTRSFAKIVLSVCNDWKKVETKTFITFDLPQDYTVAKRNLLMTVWI